MVPKVKVGIVGTGYGKYCLLPAFRRDQRIEVVAICASHPENVQPVADTFGITKFFSDWRTMLDNAGLDVVAVATPPGPHGAICQYALEKRIPIFAEKLLALRLEHSRALWRASVAYGVPTCIDYIFPELHTWRKARELIEMEQLGQPRRVHLSWHVESYDNRNRVTGWKTDKTLGGGLLQHFVSHSLYYLETFFGRIKRLSAHLAPAPDLHEAGDAHVTLALDFGSGLTASVSASNAALHGSGHVLEVYGSEATLILRNTERDPVAGFELYLGERGEDTPICFLRERECMDFVDGDSRIVPVGALVNRFLDALETGTVSFPTFAEGYRVHALIAAAQQSHNLGKVVDVYKSGPFYQSDDIGVQDPRA